jgi:hypothetical protein
MTKIFLKDEVLCILRQTGTQTEQRKERCERGITKEGMICD